MVFHAEDCLIIDFDIECTRQSCGFILPLAVKVH